MPGCSLHHPIKDLRAEPEERRPIHQIRRRSMLIQDDMADLILVEHPDRGFLIFIDSSWVPLLERKAGTNIDLPNSRHT